MLAILRRHGVEAPWVFSSSAHGADEYSSDLALVVRFREDTPLLDVRALHLEPEDVLGCPVDVVSEKVLDGRRGERIRGEARGL